MSSSETTSASLLAQLWTFRNEQAWDIFVDRYRPLMLEWCARRGIQDADAEEIAQTVLLKLRIAMKRGFTYDPQKRFRSYLRRVVDNEVATLFHKVSRRLDLPHGDANALPQPPTANADAEAEELVETLDDQLSEDRDRAVQCVARVAARLRNKDQLRAFELVRLQDQEAKVVAAELEMSVASVYKAVQRVSEMLRQEALALEIQTDRATTEPPAASTRTTGQ